MQYRAFFFLLLWYSAVTGCTNNSHSKQETKPGNGVKKDAAGYRKQIANAAALIRHGDLVLRTGNDFTSLFFKQLNLTDKTYSHCGLASVENDTVFIYHALGGEFNPDQQVQKEPLSRFINPKENEGFGVFRLSLPEPELNAILFTADSLFRKGVTFDIHFDLNTDRQMYCAEYIYKSITWGSRGHCTLPKTAIKGKTGVATDNLFINPWCREILRSRYE
jgi:Permuted papain-like amidase enzyme, YaeF/YiiX, C92 family